MQDIYDILRERDSELDKVDIEIKAGKATINKLVEIEILYQKKIEEILEYNSLHDNI